MATKREPDDSDQKQLLYVGIGASAGGLDVLKAFFGSLPEETGMAFFVIVHLAPDCESNMATLLQKETSLAVQQVTQRVEIAPDRVYVIPPRKVLSMGDHHLELSEPEQEHGFPSVDLLFRSLAEAKGNRAACVIMSGIGNDGTTGMKKAKEAGGLTIAQDPEEAPHAGMPRNAIETGLVDVVLPAVEIGDELIKYKKEISDIRTFNGLEEIENPEYRNHNIPPDANDIIDGLEEELKNTKQELQVTVEEYETSNEELRASNEELQSMNEELQSTTEELQTSQEELQSVNEELKTVNGQLENKVEELDRANSDLKNLMEATEVGILFVDREYRLQQFTDSAKKLFNLIPSDKGRPLAHLTHNLAYDSLEDDIKGVRESLGSVKKIVRSSEGGWYIMRLRPYRSTEDKIEGVVLTFVEFTQLKQARQTIREQSYQRTLATLGVYALEQRDLQAVLKRAIDLACINLELDCAIIYGLNKDGPEHDTLQISAQAGCAKEGGPVAVDDKQDIGFALRQSAPTVVLDYEEEDRFELSPFLAGEKLTSSIHMAVRGGEQTYGLFGFYSQERREFNEYEIDFLQVVANITGLAMERYEVKENLKEAVARSEQYQREILSNNIAERWRLGQYLHDSLAQALAAIKMMLHDMNDKIPEPGEEIAENMAKINAVIDENISGIRDLAHDIIPVDVEEEGFAHAMRMLMRHTQKIHGVKCSLEAEEVIKEVKNLDVATHLYHIIQEAVKNAAIHGEAERIKVYMSKEGESLSLQVSDDGVGLGQTSDSKPGKGLRIIKHRVDLLEGKIDIEEVPDAEGTGTQLSITIPLSRLPKEQEEEG